MIKVIACHNRCMQKWFACRKACLTSGVHAKRSSLVTIYRVLSEEE